jgi:hypothetical protein
MLPLLLNRIDKDSELNNISLDTVERPEWKLTCRDSNGCHTGYAIPLNRLVVEALAERENNGQSGTEPSDNRIGTHNGGPSGVYYWLFTS